MLNGKEGEPAGAPGDWINRLLDAQIAQVRKESPTQEPPSEAIIASFHETLAHHRNLVEEYANWRKTAKLREDPGERIFADEKAKTAWEIAQAVENVTASLPPEGLNLNTRLITFEDEHARKGRYALFFSGTVIGTDRKGVFSVPERSLRILDALNIPYQHVVPGPEVP